MIGGPRAELQTYLSKKGRKKDVRRVSEKGLLRALQRVQEYVKGNSGVLPTEEWECWQIMDGF